MLIAIEWYAPHTHSDIFYKHEPGGTLHGFDVFATDFSHPVPR